ncbi:hypothetical protein [Brevibacterium aurantiacum]|uniref:Uncharacterized protein n=1 Tax=Brevibacterium aurantiacum TaxID=273384 RepID=A0A2A3ZT79_BREAU|nr:hypothetical protein [Brevibacterium aurantiacum]AZL10119.1 hypothetical protein CXR26_13490 [Brevibacterium aurantiacum]PCC54575.1 hypothetical protein CIK59_06050 [Brevibacterium aurantiacum]
MSTTQTSSASSFIASTEFDDWLLITLSKFPTPGPAVSRRLVDVLGPDDAEQISPDANAA